MMKREILVEKRNSPLANVQLDREFGTQVLGFRLN